MTTDNVTKPTTTPGPWACNNSYWIMAGGHTVIAHMPRMPRNGETWYGIDNDAERFANGRLMAAAPDLLDALLAFRSAAADLNAGRRDGGTMGRISIADDQAAEILNRLNLNSL